MTQQPAPEQPAAGEREALRRSFSHKAGVRWRKKAASEARGDTAWPTSTEAPSAEARSFFEYAHAVGKVALDKRRQRQREIEEAPSCCCWDWLFAAPTLVVTKFGRHVWQRWLLPPLAWLWTMLLRVLSMEMDAWSMLFTALEEDVRYRDAIFSHGDRHISHTLASLTWNNFEGNAVALPDHEALWIVLFYSPRSKIGGDTKLTALKAELKGMTLPQLLKRAQAGGVKTENLDRVRGKLKALKGKQKGKQNPSWCPCPTEDKTPELELRQEVSSFIVRATYRRSGLEAVQRFNNAARHFDAAVTKDPANGWTRMPWPECPAYAGRRVRLGVVNVDDVMSSNDELAINMGVSSLDPCFMLLDGDNVPTIIEEEKIDGLLDYNSEFWELGEDSSGPANDKQGITIALEKMLQLVTEDRLERKAVQTDAIHALVEKTASVDGAMQSFIAKYSNRQALLRCAQHVLHGSPISTTGAMQTVLISGLLALLTFTGLGYSVLDPGWLSGTIICDQASQGNMEGMPKWATPDWDTLTSESIVDRWSCGLACQTWSRANHTSNESHTLFRYSDQCACAPQSKKLASFFNLYPQCFDDIVLDATQMSNSWAVGAGKNGPMVVERERISQLLHAKLVILRYWDVQLCRYVLQISIPGSFCAISVVRIFAGLPALRHIKSVWLPVFTVSLLFTLPIALMYVPAFLVSMSVDDIRTISLNGAHLYLAVLLMVPLVILGVGMWYLCGYCGRRGKDFPLNRWHCVWSLTFVINLVLGVRIALWTEMKIYGDESRDLKLLSAGTAKAFETISAWTAWYGDKIGDWATLVRAFFILALGSMSSVVTQKCIKADCLSVETREQLKKIAEDAERRRELESEKSCVENLRLLYANFRCCRDQYDAKRLMGGKQGTNANKWTSGNLTPHVELTVVPAMNDPHRMNSDQLHDFEASLELLLSIKLALDKPENTVEASIDTYYPGNGRLAVHVWFSPPEFLQDLLARPDKNECILGALLDPLTPAQISALTESVNHYENQHGEMKGWARQFCNAYAPGAPGSPELVRDDRKSKKLPRVRWATELDFSEIGMDRIARWYPAFFLNSMLGAFLTRLTISSEKNVRVQMLMYTVLGAVQLLKTILAWTIQQFTADAINWVTSCGTGGRLDVEQKRRLLTDDSKIRAIAFECIQFSETWAIASVLAANLIYVVTMNCPLVGSTNSSDTFVGYTTLLDLVDVSTTFEQPTYADSGGTQSSSPMPMRAEVYQDPINWSEGHIVAMAFFQLAVELPVDVLSTRALELLRQPVFSALRPHLGNSRIMYAFQICLSIAMISVIVNMKHEVVFNKLLHTVNCSAATAAQSCQPTQGDDPLNVCCYHTVLHPCNDTQQHNAGSCWIDSKDSSLVQATLGPTNSAGGENNPVLRLWHLLKGLAFVWGVVIVGMVFIPRATNRNSDASECVEFERKIRRAVDAGMKTREVGDFLTALGLQDYIYQVKNELCITHVSGLWHVDELLVQKEKDRVRENLDQLLEAEEKRKKAKTQTTVKLSELVMRDRQRGVTKADIEMMLTKFSGQRWNDVEVACARRREATAAEVASNIRSNQNLHGDRILPHNFDNWVECCEGQQPQSTEQQQLDLKTVLRKFEEAIKGAEAAAAAGDKEQTAKFAKQADSLKAQMEKVESSAKQDLVVPVVPDANIHSVITSLRMCSEQHSSMRTYLIEVTTCSMVASEHHIPQVRVELFGGHDSSSTTMATKASLSDQELTFPVGRYVVGERVYTRTSGELDLAAYEQVTLPGTEIIPPDGRLFDAGSMIAFKVRVPDIGDITAVRVWLANRGLPMSWRCERIAVICEETMVRRVFETSQHTSRGEIVTQKNTGWMVLTEKAMKFSVAQVHRALLQRQQFQAQRHPGDDMLISEQAWREEALLHKTAAFTYRITFVHTPRSKGFKGRVYVQLLGLVSAEVVAGRVLPMAKTNGEGTSWFCSEEAKKQKRGEEKLPKVSLTDEVHFDYPSMQDLGELALCRVFCPDHKHHHWRLVKVAVAIKEKKWEFPCEDQTRDETRPVPVEFLLPLDSHSDDELMSGLRDLMEREHESKIVNQLSQDLGLTEVELKLLVTSRNILKRKLQARHAVSPIAVDEERGLLPVRTENENRQDMSTVHLAVRAATKKLAAGTSELQERHAALERGKLPALLGTSRQEALAKVEELRVKQAVGSDVRQTSTLVAEHPERLVPGQDPERLVPDQESEQSELVELEPEPEPEPAEAAGTQP